MPYVMTSLAAPVKYALYRTGVDGKPVLEKTILVAGNAGVADPRTLVTTAGTATQVTKAEADLLKKNAVFAAHEKGGFVKIINSLPKDEDKAAADLDTDAGSAPATPQTYAEQGKQAPQVTQA